MKKKLGNEHSAISNKNFSAEVSDHVINPMAAMKSQKADMKAA
jgi:hypothetical protein